MKHLTFRACVIFAALMSTASTVRAEGMPMMQFNAKVEQWLRDQQEPPPLTYFVEGIISASSSERLMLAKANSHVNFQLKTELPVMSRKRPTVELTGKLRFSKRNSEFT